MVFDVFFPVEFDSEVKKIKFFFIFFLFKKNHEKTVKNEVFRAKPHKKVAGPYFFIANSGSASKNT